MYTTASTSSCSSAVIKAHLARWLSEDYLYQDGTQRLKIEPTKASVERVLGIVARDGCVYLISKTEYEIVRIHHNPHFQCDHLTGDLPFRYEVKQKRMPAPNPVRVGTGTGKGHITY